MDFLERLKKIRRKIYIKTIIIFLIFIGFLTLIICNSNNLSDVFQILIFMLPLGLLFTNTIIKMFVIKKDKQLYKEIYKKNILLNCLKENFMNVEYKLSEDDFPDGLLPKKFIEIVEDIKISGGNIFNDYISANYKNLRFEFADIEMVEQLGRPSNSWAHTSFKGQWLVLERNKKLENSIQIFCKTFKGNKKMGLLRGKKYKEIKTDDLEFDNQFNVFVESNIDVSKILTPNIIEKVKKIKKKLKLKLFICFVDNRIGILLENKKDLFEPNIYKNIYLEEEKNKILKQLKNIIEILDLDNN